MEKADIAFTPATGKIKVSSTGELFDLLNRNPDRLMAICQAFYQPRLLFTTGKQGGGGKL